MRSMLLTAKASFIVTSNPPTFSSRSEGASRFSTLAWRRVFFRRASQRRSRRRRSEEHTSELQSRLHLVCRLLLEKKKKKNDSVVKVVKLVVIRIGAGVS